jgi:hypothetical protein
MSNNFAKTTKDSKYLKSLIGAIANDPSHPKKHGIKMQAHHIIFADGMGRSGIHSIIKEFKYDINNLDNLSFIPCTLQGACYLGVQPHRGNHDSAIDESNYVDDSEPRTYHEYVSSRLKDMHGFIEKHCIGSKEENEKKVVKKLNELSFEILETIQHHPMRAPLTRIALAFGKTGVGYSGVDSVTTHDRSRPCPVDRKHLFDKADRTKSQAPGQKNEEISFVSKAKFLLIPGN